MFKTSLQMSTRCINQAAILKAAGHFIEVVRQPGSRRSIFYADDTVETRSLIEKFERKDVLPLPAKAVLNARTELYHLARVVQEGL